MIVPAILVLVSLVAVAVTVLIPGWSDLGLVAFPSAIAAAFVMFRAYWAAPPTDPRRIIVDGSNVLYWRDNTPDLAVVSELVLQLSAQGFTPGVVFDANAGHVVAGRYLNERAFGRLLGLPTDQVLVVDKGNPADPTILAAARHLGARIVTNDRYRDWAALHPEVGRPGHLIRGGFRDGALWLDLT